MMKLMLPAALKTQTSWFGPRLEITRTGKLMPADGLTFENSGALVGQGLAPTSAGVIDRYVAWVPAVAVRLNTAAAAVPSPGIDGVPGGALAGRPDNFTGRHFS